MTSKKIILSILTLFFFGYQIQAQSLNDTTLLEEEKIINVIENYIVGTSYNYPDKLKSAFIPEAKLFLDKENEPLFVVSIEKYAEAVGRSEAGKFNGRTTNILSIDRFQGIATAKLEVIIPGLEKRFIDMLLLKKLEDGWKIISKTAGSEPSQRQVKKVLIVTSSHIKKENTTLTTGNSFSEIAIAYSEYQKAGYHVDFVSPKGGKIPLAYINPSDSTHLSALYNSDFMYAIAHTKKPLEIKSTEYDIVLFTGGSAPSFDIPQNAEIQDVAMKIYNQNGVIAAVCHGTSGIANLKTSDGSYLVNGKNINGYPKEYENQNSLLYQNFPFIIEEEIEKNGGTFKYGERAKAYYVIDGRLVTGQNFQSSKVVAQKSIEVSKKVATNNDSKVFYSKKTEEVIKPIKAHLENTATTKTDLEQVRATLMDYIEGTGNGQPQRLRQAFHPDFNLYTVEEDTLWVRSGEKYIAGVKEGKKTSRIGRIISIDIEKDAAIAKAEIVVPNWRTFTDYFLLLKYEGSWKIVHKSYSWREISKNN
ncbi:nuclear transport factor 2 family protein [Bernardetia sp. ABR2-2B]|uniref:nuclear transport factor 2 family protein n=1 Tax=Bernardetia sp. ABR2-2B TaxID=3127472 RepID=UPI0030D013C9